MRHAIRSRQLVPEGSRLKERQDEHQKSRSGRYIVGTEVELFANARELHLLLLKAIIVLLGHQAVQLFGICDLNLGQPAVSFWALVDGGRLLFQDTIVLNDLSRDRGEDVGR